MALISCEECGKQISDRASSCPHCGNPMTPAVQTSTKPPIHVQTATGHVVTTEATGREWKAIQLVGGAIMIVSMVACMANTPDYGPSAGLGMLLGFGVYLFGRVGGWWKHG